MTRSRKLTTLALFSLGLTLTIASCAGTMAIDAIERRAVCSIFTPISWSVRDTDATIRAVKAHNAAHKRICER